MQRFQTRIVGVEGEYADHEVNHCYDSNDCYLVRKIPSCDFTRCRVKLERFVVGKKF